MYKFIEDRGMPWLVVTLDEEEENEIKVPCTWEVCSCCGGTGTSTAYLGSWTQDEWNEESYEFQENYLNGVYDRTCQECEGKRVVPSIQNEAYLTEEQKTAVDYYYSWLRDEAYDNAVYRAEMRLMGGY